MMGILCLVLYKRFWSRIVLIFISDVGCFFMIFSWDSLHLLQYFADQTISRYILVYLWQVRELYSKKHILVLLWVQWRSGVFKLFNMQRLVRYFGYVQSVLIFFSSLQNIQRLCIIPMVGWRLTLKMSNHIWPGIFWAGCGESWAIRLKLILLLYTH